MARFSLFDYIRRVSKARSVKRYGFRWLLFWGGIIAAQGSPVGFLVHTFYFDEHHLEGFWNHAEHWLSNEPAIMFYLWGGTTFFFSIFAWLIGYLLDNLVSKINSLEHSMVLSRHFELMKKSFVLSLADNIQNPLSVAIEFLQSLNQGIFGPISNDQHTLSRVALEELQHLNVVFKEMLSSKKIFRSGVDSLKSTRLTYILQEVKQRFENAGRARKLRFRHVDPNCDVPLQVDPHLFSLAVEQLINNVKSYSPRSIVEIRVHTEDPRPQIHFQSGAEVCLLDQPVVHMLIEAKGKALDSTVVNILGQFSRLRPAADHSSLDLFVAKNVLEWHGCEVWIDQYWTEGVRVALSIPFELKSKKTGEDEAA